MVAQPRQLQPRWRREFYGLVEFREPFNRLVGNAIFVLKDAPHPDDTSRLVLFDTNCATNKVGRLFDSLCCVDEDEAMAESTVEEHREGRAGIALRTGSKVGSAGYFSDVEFL